MSAFPTTGAPPVALLCGGLGLRQRAEGDDIPKPLRLLPDGRALLLHVLDYYRAFGLTEFVICVGYGAEAVEALLVDEFRVRPHHVEAGAGWHRFENGGVRVTLVDSGAHAGKCLRLLQAREHIGTGPFLLGYGDVLSDFDLGELARRHRTRGGQVTLAATRVRSRYGELTVDEAMAVTGFEEKPVQPALISAGYFMCAPGVFNVLSPDLELESEVLPRLVARGEVHAVVHDGLWLPFDTYKDFVDVEKLIAQRGCPWLQPI